MKSFFKNIFEFFGLKNGSFTPLEETVLLAIAERLGAESQSRLKAQMNLISRVDRSPDGVEANIYYSKKKIEELKTFHFSQTPIEFKLARVFLKETISKTKFSILFWVVNGHLFQIDYALPSKLAGSRSKLENLTGELLRCDILNDPLQPQIVELARSPTSENAHIKIKKALKRDVLISSLSDPIKESDLLRYIGQLEFEFPADYLAIMKISDGCIAGSWTLLGIENTQEISLIDGTYLMIAEMGGKGCLILKRSHSESPIYLHDYRTDETKLVGYELVDSIQKADVILLMS
jgi:hypothetical protein